MKTGSHTPWGSAQHVTRLGRGLFSVETAGHGGIYVPDFELHRIPDAHQRYAEKFSRSRNWYEEDCAVLAVIIAFPELFPRITTPKAELLAELETWMNYQPRKAVTA